MRSSSFAGTTTPGTSFAMNSAFLKLANGQIPAMIGMRKSCVASRKRRRQSASKTGCVIANSAPAITFCLKRSISRSRSAATGLAPTPMTSEVGGSMPLPPISTPRLRFRATPARATESMSKTPVALGYSPSFGGSPVMMSRFRTPIVEAPRRSDCMPIRLRSRQQKCRMASMPASC